MRKRVPMRASLPRYVGLYVALLATLLATTGCATTLRGQVVDAETKDPIQGAVVFGVWTKVAGSVLYHHELVGARETETDREGDGLVFGLHAPVPGIPLQRGRHEVLPVAGAASGYRAPRC